jgi:hypothetical protein
MALAPSLAGAKVFADFEAKIGQLRIRITDDHATVPAIAGGSGTTNMVYSGVTG